MGPIETSLEDLNLMTSGSLQVDAIPENPPNLEQKLNQELNYHKMGSYPPEPQPSFPSYSNAGPLLQAAPSSNWAGDLPQQVSSVQSWSKPNPYLPETSVRPEYERGMSVPSSQSGQFQPYKPYDRMQSWGSEFPQAAMCPQADKGTYLTLISKFLFIRFKKKKRIIFNILDSDLKL